MCNHGSCVYKEEAEDKKELFGGTLFPLLGCELPKKEEVL